MQKLVLVSLFLLAFNAAAVTKDTVIAVVNGKKIMRSLLEKRYQQDQLFLSHKAVTRKKVLDDLINRELGIQRAKENKLDQNPIVAEKINDILYHAQISKDLEDKLKGLDVSDNEVEGFYKRNKEYRTAHILIRLKANPSQEEVKMAYQNAINIYAEAKKAPAEFSKLANKHSQSDASINGGDIGFQVPTRLAPEYFNAIKGKVVGTITEPVRTQFGFHIIKVLAIKEYKDIDKNVYKKIIYDVKRDKILEDYFASQRKKANVEIMEKLI